MKGLLIFFIITLSANNVFSQEPGMHFNHYTTKDGLPINSVKDIAQDSQGFMWFATEEGLTRFDGYTFKVYIPDANNPESVRSTDISHVLASRNGNIWVGGFDGLDSYDPKTGIFHHLDLDGLISCLQEDSKGNLWISTHDLGVFVYHPRDSSFTAYQHDPDNANSLHGNFVKSSIYEDRNGAIWIGAGGTLQSLDLSSGTFTNYPYQAIIRSILEDNQGNLWLCNEAGALVNLDRQDSSMVYHLRNENTYGSVDDWFSTLFKDSKGSLWVGTGSQGLILFDAESGEAKRYEHDINDDYSISSNSINDIYEDKAGNLWIATERGGINFLGFQRQPFMSYTHNADDPQSLSSNVVCSFFERPNGDMWVGTIGGGLNLFNRNDRTFTSFPAPNWANNAGNILEDSQGYVWFGNGFKFMPPHIDKLEKYNFHWVNSMLEDNNGNVWIGFINGLARYDRDNDQFSLYTHYDSIESSLSQQEVVSLYEDSKQRFWIGTMGGLDIYDRENDNFIHFNTKPTFGIWEDQNGNLFAIDSEGMNKINAEEKTEALFIKQSFDFTATGALMDGRGNIWFPTKGGDIIRFNIETQTYIVFDDYHENEFDYRSQYLSSTGEMYFGGKQGFLVFHPDSIKDNLHVPPVVITDFRLFNQSVPVAATYADSMQWESPLAESISFTQEMTLPYNYNIFSLEFAALNYAQSYRNQYKYKLEGFNDDWVYPPATNRIATYTNLSPGPYQFRVMGSNENGVWNEEGISISIRVLPPWWLTWWAKTGYFLILFGSVWGFIYVRTQRHKRKLREVEQLNAKLQQIDKLKDQFLANTSHEIRTPLQGIIGLSESLVDGVAGKVSAQAKDLLQMIMTSGKRLSYLINDILDFSKLKNNELSLQLRPVDLHAAANIVLTLVRPLINKKQLKLKNSVPRMLPLAFADENRVQQVFQNLVGNAIKFTEKGSVSISAKEQNGQLEVTVSDTGIGISNEKLESIFNAFEQADGTIEREYGGTGLGLSVTKQLVELHGGNISVMSRKGQGSDFMFTLPKCDINRKDYPDLEFAQGLEETIQPVESSVKEVNDNSVAMVQNGELELDESRGRILVVDDEPVNLQVVQNYLSMAGYEITLANSGMEAIAIIQKEKQFDLILLDVMMPKLSGYEVCNQLRKMFLPSELPVVLLTAKNRVSDLVDGFTAGANDYLTKPFSKDELLSRIKIHLHLQKINKATGRFVPFEFLHYIGRESIVDVHLGDQSQQEVTVLFCDIRDYTTLAEDMSPEDNFKLINSFVGKMGPIIKQNKGFVNQFIGDAIMAIFPKNIVFGLRAAIQMQIKLSEYNKERIDKGRIPYHIGIGLHTGPLIMGIIGYKDRTDTTTIADTVNIASRMEGLTKYYGVQILISQDSYSKLAKHEAFHFRYLGEVLVKGKFRPVKIYECYDGEDAKMFNDKNDSLKHFKEGLNFYFNKDFPEASVSFNNIVKMNPNDKTAEYYYKLAIKYAMNGVPENWSGIEQILKK